MGMVNKMKQIIEKLKSPNCYIDANSLSKDDLIVLLSESLMMMADGETHSNLVDGCGFSEDSATIMINVMHIAGQLMEKRHTPTSHYTVY